MILIPQMNYIKYVKEIKMILWIWKIKWKNHQFLNTFTQNLNIKWRDMIKDDINNLKKKDDNTLSNNEMKKNKLFFFNKENTIDKFDEIRKNHL